MSLRTYISCGKREGVVGGRIGRLGGVHDGGVEESTLSAVRDEAGVRGEIDIAAGEDDRACDADQSGNSDTRKEVVTANFWIAFGPQLWARDR